MPVDNFRGKYACFSNFHDSRMIVSGVLWQTVEHPFQANKTFDKEWQQKILEAVTPTEAKRLARKLKKLGLQRPDWEQVNIRIMYCLVLTKFMMFAEYRRILLGTVGETLIEGNWWHDNFWGDCTCEKCATIEGENHLGRILTLVREYLEGFSIFSV